MTRTARILLALCPVAFAALAYHPIVGNYFYADDFPNLFHIENLPVAQYLLRPHGGHLLLTRNLVFFASAKLFGPEPACFFSVVLITHLLNAWLLFRLIDRLGAGPRAACFAATLWAIAPLHARTLGWYSVYGHVLVGTILLVVLGRMAALARGQEQPPARVAWLWFLLALLAATCFGTGIGFAMALPIAAAVLLPDARRHLPRLAPVILLPAVVPVLYLGLLRAHAALSGIPYGGAGAFTNIALARWDHVLALLLALIGFALSRLPSGFLDVPPAFPDLASYAVLAAFAVALLWLVWRSPAARRPVLASLVLLLAVYGTVAAGRVVGEAMVVGTGRYHYVGMMMAAVLLGLCVAELGARLRLPGAVEAVALGAWLAFTAATWLRFGPAIDHHDAPRAEVERVLATIRRKVEQTPPGGAVFITNRRFQSLPPLLFRVEEFPGWAGVFVAFEPENTIDGRRIYFMLRPPNVRERFQRGRRTAGLFTAPRPGVDPVQEQDSAQRDALQRAMRRREKPRQ